MVIRSASAPGELLCLHFESQWVNNRMQAPPPSIPSMSTEPARHGSCSRSIDPLDANKLQHGDTLPFSSSGPHQVHREAKVGEDDDEENEVYNQVQHVCEQLQVEHIHTLLLPAAL